MYLGVQSFLFNSKLFSSAMKDVRFGVVSSTLGIQSFCMDIKGNHEAKKRQKAAFIEGEKRNNVLTLLEKAF